MGYLHVGGTMSMVAPKGRKHLSADALFRLVRNGFARILDDCAEEPGISLTDALMSAFAMFSLKAPSLLAFDKERVEGNLQTLYGIEQVPCDTYMLCANALIRSHPSHCVLCSKASFDNSSAAKRWNR